MRDWFESVDTHRLGLAIVALVLVSAVTLTTINSLPVSSLSYSDAAVLSGAGVVATGHEATKAPVKHIPTPVPLRGIYMTACAADSAKFRDSILSTIASTSINAVVVDIKDYTGTRAFADTQVEGPIGKGCKISNLPELIARLHSDGLYAIARVTVFQDPLYANAHPDIAVQSLSQPGKPWRDRKGLAYIDPNYDSYWSYIVAIAKEAYEIGFDEVNFDYIRFPSDGNMDDAEYGMPVGSSKVVAMEKFFAYLQSELKPIGVVISADVFGQTTINYDDLGIGQVLESFLPYFDYVLPMVYPSHFIDGFMGFNNPADHPYDVIKMTMVNAVERAVTASSTPSKIRPWLQAFDYKARYTPDMVKQQIQAVNDAGLDSWILWDAANRYDRRAL